MQLHVFCDASNEAYGAVAYLRCEKNEEIYTVLVGSKTRVAPTKTRPSIPRKELMGAVLGGRLLKHI